MSPASKRRSATTREQQKPGKGKVKSNVSFSLTRLFAMFQDSKLDLFWSRGRSNSSLDPSNSPEVILDYFVSGRGGKFGYNFPRLKYSVDTDSKSKPFAREKIALFFFVTHTSPGEDRTRTPW